MKRTLLVCSTMLVAACTGPQQGSPTARFPPTTQTASENAHWAAYREFTFDSSSTEISIADTPKLREIVAYVASDSSLDVAIDGTLDNGGFSQEDRAVSARRAASIRLALMDTGAGIASYKIQMGPFGAAERRRPGQIQVLIGPRTGLPRSPSSDLAAPIADRATTTDPSKEM